MKKFKVNLLIKRTIYVVFIFELIFLGISFFIDIDREKMSEEVNVPSDFNLLNVDESRKYQRVKIEEIAHSSDLIQNESYKKAVLSFEQKEEMEFKIEIEEAGKYQISFDYFSLNKNVEKTVIDFWVNDSISEDYRNIELLTPWKDVSKEEIFDIYNNQVTSMQENAGLWKSALLYDQQYLKKDALIFDLNSGVNTFKIEKKSGKFLLGDLYFYENKPLDTYENYQNNLKQEETQGQMIVLEGENPILKSNPEIRMESAAKTGMTPFSTSKNLINTLSGSAFNESGTSVTYGFNVKIEGLYQISLKYLADQNNTNIYSKIFIDNKILFEELNRYRFKGDQKSFQNTTLKVNDNNVNFYLTEGFHTLTLQLDSSHQAYIYEELGKLIDEINALSLEVIKLTNGNVDTNKVWDLDKYLPTAKTRMMDFEARIKALMDYAAEITKSNPKKQNRLYQLLQNAYVKMQKLNQNPNKLPNQLNLFSEGNTSVGKMLSEAITNSVYSPLSIDKIYIHSKDVKLPKTSNSFFKENIAIFQKIRHSGINVKDDKDTINIWVNRNTYYVSLMQQFSDAYYTKNTGQKIRFSLLPDEAKIIYANASNTQPDAAFGVSSLVPYDLGIRGALVDMRSLAGFSEVISEFAPGSLINKIVEDRVYGLPETQDFQVTFYRTDLMKDLGIEVPNTYEEIIEVLPALQRYGLNYYIPMAGGSGLKSIANTAPFIYQYGGNLYSEDYMSAALDSKEAITAINQMVDLFSIYSLPLTAQNFYQSFRDGRIPVGIGNFDQYLSISLGAPEIQGKWEITLAPGVKRADGMINRTNTGVGKEVILFNKGEKVDATWEFIKWWLQTDTQSHFANNVQQTYGESFLWNTANLKAFETLAIPKRHIDVILKQWEELLQIPQIPATYILERGISDIWNKAVFNQQPVRALVSDMMIEMNNEIKRKMREFHYLDKNNQPVKPYYVASIDEIKSWMKEKKNE